MFIHSFILGTWPRASFCVLYRMLSDLRRRKIKRFALMMVTGKQSFPSASSPSTHLR